MNGKKEPTAEQAIERTRGLPAVITAAERELRAQVRQLEARERELEHEVGLLHERCAELETELELARQQAEVSAKNLATVLDGEPRPG